MISSLRTLLRRKLPFGINLPLVSIKKRFPPWFGVPLPGCMQAMGSNPCSQ
jgi:hypothetical protein